MTLERAMRIYVGCTVANIVCLATAVAFANVYGWFMGDLATVRAELEFLAQVQGVELPDNPETVLVLNLFTVTTTGLIGTLFFASSYWSLRSARFVLGHMIDSAGLKEA